MTPYTEQPSPLPVSGTVREDDSGVLLVLDRRLTGQDTYLSGRLEADGHQWEVQILSLDAATFLRPRGDRFLPTGHWTGTLHLGHRQRPRKLPADLAAAADHDRRDISALDGAELRYALTYLGESSTTGIRAARVAAIVSALPTRAENAA